jgi:hypothetical protein
MSRLLRLRLPTAVAVLLAAVVGSTAGAPAATAALPPNTSIFFWAPGAGVTGTVHNGIFNQNDTVTTNMSGWTAGAVTRDTLLLYNKSNGNGAIATFTGGHLSPSVPKTITGLGKGYALAAGSCDTVLLDNPGTGKALLLLVHGGKITHRKMIQVPKHVFAVDASCNTVSFWLHVPMASGRVTGVLKGGSFTKKETSIGPPTGILETHSTDSVLFLDEDTAEQAWGTSGGGHEKVTTEIEPPYSVNMLAGTADSALLYNSATGFGDFGSLTGGVFQSVVTTTNLSANWKIIIGGR